VRRQRGEARAARRWLYHHLREAGAGGRASTCVQELPCKCCLFIDGLSSLRVAPENRMAKREAKAWSLGQLSVRGGSAGAVATLKPTP